MRSFFLFPFSFFLLAGATAFGQAPDRPPQKGPDPAKLPQKDADPAKLPQKDPDPAKLPQKDPDPVIPQPKDQDPSKQPQAKDELRKEALKLIIQKAQEEYRLFFKEPKTAVEFWAAASFEIQVGKFDIAAYHLDKLLQVAEKDRDEDLLKIEEAEGLNAFMRLRLVKEWSKDPLLEADARKTVDTLIDLVLATLDKHLGNRERIVRLIEGLSAKVPEIRAFALYQLQRSKHRAAPALAEALRSDKAADRSALKNAMLALDRDIVPPLLELYRARDAKGAAEVQFLMDLLWLAKARGDQRVIPYLWHMSSAPIYPQIVRDEAKTTLAYLRGTTADWLPAAKVALTQLAEDYYQYKVRWPDVTEVADRDNPAKQILMPAYKMWFLNEAGGLKDTPDVLRPDDARFEFGLRYARQAIELDPTYQPAQAIYLAFLLEAEFGRKPHEGQLDKLTTEKSSPSVQRLLAQVDIDLLATVLERAMLEQNYAVMLPLIDAVGDRGDTRLAQPSGTSSPGLLVKLLYYPDRRVQFAAARALLRLPASPTPMASTRIVQVLRRFLATDPAPKVLIAFAQDERAAELRKAAQVAGYDSAVAGNLKQALELLHGSADFDAILLNDAVTPAEMPFVLTQLRADHEAGRLPLLFITPSAKESEMKALAAKTRNAFVLPDVWATTGPELKRQIEDAVKLAATPEPLRKAPQDQQQWLQYEVRRAKGQALSDLEKKRFARDALDWFAHMARGELTGYDLLPAKNALVDALNREDMAGQALRIIARLPTAEAQQRLAGILFDAKKANLHVDAAQELNRHIQRFGVALKADQINLLRQMEQIADVQPSLRTELAILVGTLRTIPQMTGARLLNYTPDPSPKK